MERPSEATPGKDGQRPVVRRSPNQARSRDKLELIFEASIRILNKQGLDGLTTNRIAEVAGVSIGTLYQYFSNKQEILAALGQREIQATIAKITEQFFAGHQEADKLKLLVHVLLNAFDGRHQVRKILLDIALSQQGIAGMDKPVQQVTTFLRSPMAGHLFGNVASLTEMDLFVLTSAVTGIIRSALVRDTDMLSRQELEDKIVIMIRAYLEKLQERKSSHPTDSV
jgi:AcrR family transcriptional regulator